MKKTFVVLGIILLGFSAQAQTQSADVKAIKKQLDALISSWNNDNYKDMANYTTADCDWVNIVGMWWKGRKQVQFAHQAYHKVMFKDVKLTNRASVIRFVTKDVALVHHTTQIGKFTTPDGHQMPEAEDMALLVFVKQNGKWLLTSGENMVIDAGAQKNDPVLHMK